MSKNEGVMKNTELPKIRAGQAQLAALRTKFNRGVDDAMNKEDVTGLGRSRAKALFSDILSERFEPIENPEMTVVGSPGLPISVEVNGPQGAGKTLILRLLDTIDRSVRSENLVFQQAVFALTNYIADWGLARMVSASAEGVMVDVKNGYEGLFSILREALDQAQEGKGDERHNPTGAVPFEEQRMQTISRMIGSVKGMEYQAIKKITEGLDMPELDRQVKELLGAVNYLAGIIFFLRSRAEEKLPD